MSASAGPPEEPRPGGWRPLLWYLALLAATAAGFLWIRSVGERLEPGIAPAAATSSRAVAPGSSLAQVLLALATVTLLARVLGGLFRRFLGQPAVIGEIVAGIALGPSVLGHLWPQARAALLPDEVAPHLGMISKLGVVLFMFLVGLQLEPRLLRHQGQRTVAISHSSIVLPFLLGTALALVLYPEHAGAGVSFTAFALFLGVALAITAFPVLARMLIDRGVQHTPLGATALACAAIDDVTAWTLLALVVGVARAELGSAGWTVLWVVVYAALMVLVVRPLLARHFARRERRGPLSHTDLALVFTALLGSAFVTEALGIHALFGAFLLGAILPRQGRLAEGLRVRLEDVVLVLFLPSFFAFTGLRTEIGLLSGARDWLLCGLVIVAATVGKFGGTFAAARLTGLDGRHSAALGILMNTRGLMELIVLDLGLELGVLAPTAYAMLVLMALATTFATTPLLDLVLGRRGFGPSPAGED